MNNAFSAIGGVCRAPPVHEKKKLGLEYIYKPSCLFFHDSDTKVPLKTDFSWSMHLPVGSMHLPEERAVDSPSIRGVSMRITWLPLLVLGDPLSTQHGVCYPRMDTDSSPTGDYMCLATSQIKMEGHK